MPANGTEVAGQDVQKQQSSAAETAPEALAAGLEPAERPTSSQPAEAAQVTEVQGGDSSDGGDGGNSSNSIAARQAAAGADICALRAQIEQDVLHELQGHETVAYLQQLEDTNFRQGQCCSACLFVIASGSVVEAHMSVCWGQLQAPSTPAWQAIVRGDGSPTALETLSGELRSLAATRAWRVQRDLLEGSFTFQHSAVPTS